MNIDLSKLSSDELDVLEKDIKFQKIRNQENKALAVMRSPEFLSLQKEWDDLKARMDKAVKAKNFVSLTLDLKLKLSTTISADYLYRNYEISDFFNHEIEAKVIKSNVKLTKDQIGIIERLMRDDLEMIDFFPSSILETFKDLEEERNKLVEKTHDTARGLTPSDFRIKR